MSQSGAPVCASAPAAGSSSPPDASAAAAAGDTSLPPTPAPAPGTAGGVAGGGRRGITVADLKSNPALAKLIIAAAKVKQNKA